MTIPLYITHRTRHVRLENGGIVVDSVDESGREKTDRVLLRDVSRVIVSGSPHITLPVLKSFCRAGVPLALVSGKGAWFGELSGACTADGARRVAQYRCAAAGEEARMRFAGPAIAAKIANQRFVLRRLAQRSGNDISETAARLRRLKAAARHANTLAELRGIEGAASAVYFSALAPFFPQETPFHGRSRRPPRDAGNALISFVYTVLASELEFAVRAHGLDPALGFMHEALPGRPALALDLLEPFRPAADAFALSLLRRKILTMEHFREDGAEGVYLKDDAHAKFFGHYEKAVSREASPDAARRGVSLRQALERQVFRFVDALTDSSLRPEFFRLPA